jgi:pentatricopeptide repeat protein
MNGDQATRVRFGAFEVDLGSGELFSVESGTPQRRILLQEQPFRVLRMLIDRAGQVASREELRKQLWPNDTEVDFDHSINVAIGTLRRVLGDSAANPKYIETLGRRGYRLIVEVDSRTEPAGASTVQQELPTQTESAPEVASAPYTGKRISHYRVLELIGGGGMGMVYKAEDLKLGRRVALKFLPEELAGDPAALKRFEREAQTASSLNHPNICTIYAIDEFEGKPFIVMELLEGETLRDCLAARAERPFALEEIVRINIQVCSGLHAAHSNGIIHRDIKPANIFLTREGIPKILDFGLAKLVADEGFDPDGEAPPSDPARMRPPRDHDANLTLTGMAIGTAGYMSPEQIRKEPLDARTDLFSFGLVLYEMATGSRAFSADSIAAVHEVIQTQAPASIHQLNKSLPLSFERIVNKALEKDRDQRYHSAGEMREDLQQFLGRKRHVSPDARWRIGAAVLLAAIASAGLLYWREKTADRISARDSIVVADVTNQSADSVLDDALNTALSTELAQTPFLNVLEPDKVRETLVELHQDPAGKVTPEIAREVCLRTNSKAEITSSVKDVGNAYSLQLDAIDCRTGKSFATASGSASRDQLIHTLGVLAEQLRLRAGEPRSSVTRYSRPLEIVTSASPEALRDLANAYRLHMRFDPNAIDSYRLAIDADRNFALAHIGLAAIYSSTYQLDLARIAAARAHELRDRLTTHDQFLDDTLYLDLALGEYDKSVPIFEQWVQQFPTDLRARVNFSTSLNDLGRYDDAIVQSREALRLWPAEFSYTFVIGSLANAGRYEEATALFREAVSRHMDGDLAHRSMMGIAEVQDNRAGIDEQLAWSKKSPSTRGAFLEAASWWEGNRGRLHYSFEMRAEASKVLIKAASPYTDTDRTIGGAMAESEMGDPRAAKQLLDSVLANAKGPFSLLQNVQLAYAFARIGDIQSAHKYLAKVEAALPESSLQYIYASGMIRAAIQLNENDPAGAIRTLEPVRPYDYSIHPEIPAGFIPSYIRGLAYLKLGDGHSAALEFQKLISHPMAVWTGITCLNSLSLLQLARAQVLEGARDDARESYKKFLAQWKDADPDIPVYRQAKAEYAALH